MSWVLNAYTVVFAALLIPAGRFADRIARHRLFMAAVVGFTLASALCGIAPWATQYLPATVWMLLVASGLFVALLTSQLTRRAPATVPAVAAPVAAAATS